MDGAIKSEPRMSMQAAEDDDGWLNLGLLTNFLEGGIEFFTVCMYEPYVKTSNFRGSRLRFSVPMNIIDPLVNDCL